MNDFGFGCFEGLTDTMGKAARFLTLALLAMAVDGLSVVPRSSALRRLTNAQTMQHHTMQHRHIMPRRTIALSAAADGDDEAAAATPAAAAAATTEEGEGSSEAKAEGGAPEINNMGEWVEARKQWEIDNVGNPMDVGAPDDNEFLSYAVMAIGSFALGLAFKASGGQPPF